MAIVAAVVGPGATLESVVPDHCTCDNDHRSLHMCSHCKWRYFFLGSWEPVLRDMHLMNGMPHASPIIKGDGPNFNVGCYICRQAKLRCTFGKFKVMTPSYLQLVSFKRHCARAQHVQAAARLGIDVVLSDEAALNVSLVGVAPSKGKFVWALTTAFCHSSYKDYSRFVQTQELVQSLREEMQMEVRDEQLAANLQVINNKPSAKQ